MFDFKKALSIISQIPSEYTRICGVDTETTGVHLHHYDLPFMVSFTYDDGENYLYTADVDPMTRIPKWEEQDLVSIQRRLEDPSVLIVMSNAKFDIRALSRILPSLDTERLLRSTEDTIQQHHAIHSLERHGLKGAAVKYSNIPDDDEDKLHQAVNKARSIAGKLGWKIANKVNCPQSKRAPSKTKDGRGGWGVMDMWLVRAVIKHRWETSQAGRRLEKAYKFAKGVELSALEAMYGSIQALVAIKEFTVEVFLKKDQVIKNELRTLSGWQYRPDGISGRGHRWWNLCGIYCSGDTLRTVVLHNQFTHTLHEEGLHHCYAENLTTIPISFETEELGVTFNATTAKNRIKELTAARENAQLAMEGALHFQVNADSPKQIRKIVYNYFGFPVERYTSPKSNKSFPQPSTDGDALASIYRNALLYCPTFFADFAAPVWDKTIEKYKDYKKRLDFWHERLVAYADETGRTAAQALAFVTSLLVHKKATTTIRYSTSYLAAGQPLLSLADLDFLCLHPSFNPIGTGTTRYSGSSPNPQNISKGGKGKKGLEWLMFKMNFSLRDLFGPSSGREWWDFDYSQIQLVIFAFLCGDSKMIAAAIRGDDFHTFVARELLPRMTDRLWEDLTKDEKKYYRDIAKQINFAFIFGAQEAKLERMTGVQGMYRILKEVFPKAVAYLERTEWDVKRHGFVTTPGGYRLFVPEDQAYAGVNYIIQGAEGEIMKRAQYGIQAYLLKHFPKRHQFYMNLYIHDALVFDCLKGTGYDHIGPINRIAQDAALSYGFQVRTEASYIPVNWGNPIKVQLA